MRLLYWNIQNGMWAGQEDDYAGFVDWVKSKSPDVCVWCEAESLYKTGTAEPLTRESRYLVKGWTELARRYGHDCVYVGAHRDDYPQVVTSRHPIENVRRITGGGEGIVVTHGASWSRVEVGGTFVNIVTLHTWPHKFAPGEARAFAEPDDGHAGDRYRRGEIEAICQSTIGTSADARNELWMMMGDFNSRSRVDNAVYQFPEDDPRLLVHDYIAAHTPYVDVVAAQHPGEFHSTMPHASRIDFVYCTPALYRHVKSARVENDAFTEPVKTDLANFFRPSDHRPIVVDFDFSQNKESVDEHC